jgi:hypothetical protein
VPHSANDYGEIRIGRFYVVEMEKATETTDGKLSVSGQESSPPTTPAALVSFLHGQIVGMQEGHLVPVAFEDKAERNGYYAITSASSDLTNYQDEVVVADWQVDLSRHGSSAEVDIQSRLTGAVRQNDFSLTGTRWHAPAIGHYAYHTGSTLPSGSVTRDSEDGDIVVYTGVPADVHPRWGCAVEDFYGGRVRVTDTLEVSAENEVEGINRQLSASGWSISNGLINVSPTSSGGIITIEYWTGSAWASQNWLVQRNFTNVTAWSSAALIRNDFEQCVLRLVSPDSAGGRTTVDLSLRRGARFIEGFMQNSTSTSLRISPANLTASASGTGYQIASAGTHRMACGSARTFVVNNTDGGIYRAATTVFDFWIGPVINAASPATGDAVTDLRNQYIATMPEITYIVRR